MRLERMLLREGFQPTRGLLTYIKRLKPFNIVAMIDCSDVHFKAQTKLLKRPFLYGRIFHDCIDEVYDYMKKFELRALEEFIQYDAYDDLTEEVEDTKTFGDHIKATLQEKGETWFLKCMKNKKIPNKNWFVFIMVLNEVELSKKGREETLHLIRSSNRELSDIQKRFIESILES